MDFLFQHFWILLIASTVFNAFWFRSRSAQYAVADPSLKPGYQKLFWGFLGLGNLPWLILAAGDLATGDGFATAFLLVGNLNVFGILFHVSVIALGLALLTWVFVGQGASFLARHPGYLDWGNMYTKARDNRAYVKLVSLVLVGAMVVAEVILWTM